MDDEPPSDATIRRALAECLTVSDIDDAMGWCPGTARRRRWRDPPDGLPPADAEVGGVAVWFRSTVSRWRGRLDAPHAGSAHPPPAPEPPPTPAPEALPPAPAAATPAAPPPPRPALPVQPATEAPEIPPAAEPGAAEAPEPASAQPEGTAADGAEEPDAAEQDEIEDTEEAEDAADEDAADHGSAPSSDAASTEPSPDHASGPPPAVDALPPGDEPGGASVRSGYELEIGERVFALVHRRWRPATVQARARTTVVVDYRLGGGALDERRQRVAVDRVRRI